MSEKSQAIRQAFESGNGIFRLAPTWVPRAFCIPGRRIKLHPDDYYALGGKRGGIDERWLASTTFAENGPETPAYEGVSHVVTADGLIPLTDVVEELGAELLGKGGGIDHRHLCDLQPLARIRLLHRCGTGGNNVPLVGNDPDVYCIVGNAIDRQPQNGGNGFGYQEDISYTLTAMDRHAIFSRQRTDVFRENDVVSTESARQHKDATDLVMQPYQETVGSLVRSDHKGISNQYVSDDKCIVSNINLIRRLTPLECERLQGFPDGWTNIPSASDSARYKALGNSVAIPCVEFVMKGVATFLKYENEKRRRRRGWRIRTCSLMAA